MQKLSYGVQNRVGESSQSHFWKMSKRKLLFLINVLPPSTNYTNNTTNISTKTNITKIH